jgi:hypothetical protein
MGSAHLIFIIDGHCPSYFWIILKVLLNYEPCLY